MAHSASSEIWIIEFYLSISLKYGTVVIKALKKEHTKHYELLRYFLLFPVDQH